VLHKTFTLDAVDVDRDQGTFTAIVSAWEADREKDVIDRHAFDRTIEAWKRSGKNLPLLFEHSTTVVGSVDPASMRPTAAGLVVAGEVDRSTDEGRQVWRSIKSGVCGFSIGFMSESRPRPGGGRVLTEIDLIEVSATSTPMHPSTRALSWKAATADAEIIPSEADQRHRLAHLFSTEEDESAIKLVDVLNQAFANATAGRPTTKSSEPQTKSTEPIRIATFPVE
jgi:HK97 family phage prohead protease